MRNLRVAATALSLSLILPLSFAHADTSANIRSSVLDVERYLLLYSDNGDERFWAQMSKAENQLSEQIKTAKSAVTLEAILYTYQEHAGDVRAVYSKKTHNLGTALNQAFEILELLDTFLPADHSGSPPGISDNLRTLAVLDIRQDTPLATASDRETIDSLTRFISSQIDSLASDHPKIYPQVLQRWKYLQTAQRDGKTLLYPFNAQIEYILTKLENCFGPASGCRKVLKAEADPPL
ncbi:hypothetical protein [Pseudomonas sp. EL_65y_Pfl2_R95]|uniref:hypothetical protein n=1 Tax=Pseudomonas sp. EL_65y_Pfl2_R95 TaxID=3088698 RepID=UPI0030DB082D